MNTSRNIARRLITLSVSWLFIQFVFAGAVFAQCKPAGTEFRVNTYTEHSQNRPSAAGLSGGGFVVTWGSDQQEGGSSGVYGQIFDRSGKKVGQEFRVNTYTGGFQGSPSLAGLSGGGFVVIWISMGQNGSDYGVYGQIFDRSGKKVGHEFRVNTHTTDHQHSPSVAGLSGGGFVVTWASYDQDGSSNGVNGQLFDRAGKKVGGEFRVKTPITSQHKPSVPGLSEGGFVVAWTDLDQDRSLSGVFGQVFNKYGKEVGSQFRVNTHLYGAKFNPSVAGLSRGGFAVTWASFDQDGSSYGVYGQVFDSAGNKVGGEFRVNTYTTDCQELPSVAGLSDGGFVVTWTSEGQDRSSWGVFGQVFDSAGNKVGGEFRVNTYTKGTQRWPIVAGLPDGGFVITWASEGQDGSDYGVYGQRFSCRPAVLVPHRPTVTP